MEDSSKTAAKDKNDVGQVWNFRGRFADYMRDLYRGDQADYRAIFEQLYDGYAFCVLYGVVKGRRHIYDVSTDNPNNSPVQGFRWTSASSSGLYSYDLLRKFVLLYSKVDNKNFDEKIDRALRYDYKTNDVADPELKSKSLYKDNSDLIDEYALGGLELIHSKIMEISSTQAMISFMKEALKDIQDAVKPKQAQNNKQPQNEISQ